MLLQKQNQTEIILHARMCSVQVSSPKLSMQWLVLKIRSLTGYITNIIHVPHSNYYIKRYGALPTFF